MADVYLYEANASDFDSIGIVGALIPKECTFKEIANGNSTIHMVHPIDDLGRYKQIERGRILKVAVPVRTAPEIKDGRFVTVVEQYTVMNTATKSNRYIYNRKTPDNKKDKKLKLVPVGGVVTILAKYTDDSDRWKCSYSYKSGKKKKTVKGYIDHESTTLHYEETRTIAESSEGIETVAPSWATKDQLFRIYNVQKSMDGVTVDAQHISYDLMYNLTTFDESGSKTAQEALNGVLNGCIEEDHGFTAETNLSGSKQGYHYADKDPITAFLDPEIGIVTRYSGQLIRDNYMLYVLDQAGENRGMRIEYGKNLKSFDYSIDTSNMVTAIRPYGETEKKKRLYLTKSYVVSADGKTTTEIAGDTRGIVFAHGYQDAPIQRIYPLEGEDCTEDKDKGTNATIVRNRLLEQARQMIENGAAEPSISVSVNMIHLADTTEYAKYADLEKYFLFDTVKVFHRGLDVDVDAAINEVEYDCIIERMLSITLGDLVDNSPSVASWQISSVNGAKLIYGTVGNEALGNGVIEARHLQADSVSANAITAHTITSDHISTYGLDANVIKTGTMSAERIDAGTLDAKVGNIVQANIQSADINYAHIADLNAGTGSVDYLFTKDGNAEKYYFEKLGVTSAQILSLMVGLLVLRGNDGKYYEISVGTDANGNVTFAPKEYTGTITHDEATGVDLASGGRYVFEDTVDVQSLIATNANIADAVITNINASKLVSSDAFISRLVTRTIIGGASLEDIAKVNTLIRLLPDGGGISISDTDTNTTGEVLIDKESVNIKMNGQTYSRFASKYVEFGNYQLRKSKDGGLVFKMRD